jgi:hypothetical protein
MLNYTVIMSQYIWYVDDNDILLAERMRSYILFAQGLAEIMQPVLQHYDTGFKSGRRCLRWS